MGARLAAYYAEAEGLAGLDGKIRLAMLTRIPSTRALIEPDSPDNVHKFEGAMNALRRSGGGPQRHGTNPNGMAPPVYASERSSGSHRAMANSEELFWGVLGALHDSVVCVFERDGRCLMVWESRSLEQRYAAAEPGSVGDNMARLVSSHFGDQLKAVFDGGSAHQSELACSILSQQTWLFVSLSAAHDSRGNVLGVHAFLQDITEQKRHEEGLRRSEGRLREQARTCADLMARCSESAASLEDNLRRITEAAVRTLDVARAGVWLFDSTRSSLVSVDLHDGHEHLHGQRLLAENCPAYFHALAQLTGTLSVHEAETDSRTTELADSVLHPFHITSLLVAPICNRGEVVGVVSLEHRGPPRSWMPDEEHFGHMLASFAALSLRFFSGSPVGAL